MLPRSLVIALAIVVTLGWIANLASYLLTQRGDPQVNLLFGLVIGAVFGLNRIAEVVKRRANDMLKPDRDPADKDVAP